MKGFESPPQFNPEDQPKKIERPSHLPVEQASGSSPSPSKIVETVGSAKKRISAHLREYFRQLNQKDFDQLLDFDFQEHIRDNPPIEGLFSPEDELAKIISLPREQKREALATFKENLARQREALAACRVFIERAIEFNHDTPREKLLGLVEQFGAKYGFNDQQKQVAEQLIDGYYENRRRVLEIRKKYADDNFLVGEVSGVHFDNTAKFDVSTGPMSLDIATDGFNAGRIYQKSENVVAKLPYCGFAAQSSHERPVMYIVINKSIISQGTRTHEYEHQKNRLFRKIFDKQVSPWEENMLFTQYEAEQDPETKRELLEAYFRLARQEALQRAKDEIIAMKKDRNSNSYDLFFNKGNSPYDYLAYIRDWEQKKDDTLWQETAQRVLVEDYKQIVEGAIAAFDQLEKKGKYTREEIIAMFADKALPEWSKTTRRLLGRKKG